MGDHRRTKSDEGVDYVRKEIMGKNKIKNVKSIDEMDDDELPLTKKEQKQIKKFNSLLTACEVRLKPRELETDAEAIRLRKQVSILFDQARQRLERAEAV